MVTIGRRLALAGLLTCVVAGRMASAIPAEAWEAKAATIKGWGQAIDPDGDCVINPEADAVSIKVPGTAHDFAAELKRWNAPRVVSEVVGDFVAEVRISGTFKPGEAGRIPGRRPYHGAGLIVFKDPNTCISLHRGCVNVDGKSRDYANFELRKDGELVVSRDEIGLPDRDAFLRLERRGNRFLNATSLDGVHWASYGELSLEMPDSLQIGIVGINSSDRPLVARYQDFALFRKAIVK